METEEAKTLFPFGNRNVYTAAIHDEKVQRVSAALSAASSYLISYSFWEAHQGSCGLACVSLRLHLSVILSAASDSQVLQRQCKEIVRE